MSRLNTLAAGMAVVVCGLAMSPSAQAQNIQSRLVTQTGSNMCKLSVPTIDSQVRPRATGFRNEGTTNVFVICPFNSPPGATNVISGIADAGVYLCSMDGANHPSVSCTGVNSLSGGAMSGIPAPQFVVKTNDINTTGGFGAFGVPYWWHPEDFGATGTIPSFGGAFSVTCILPPQVGIKVGFANSNEDVGS
jgi:hypothetical protein